MTFEKFGHGSRLRMLYVFMGRSLTIEAGRSVPFMGTRTLQSVSRMGVSAAGPVAQVGTRWTTFPGFLTWTAYQAGQKLDADFHLGLSREHIDAREMERQETERRAIAGLHERFETWRGKTIDRLNEVCYIAHTSLKRLPAPLSDREALAVRFSARAGYFSDLLEAGTPEDQAKIFQEREEVDAWTARILNGS